MMRLTLVAGWLPSSVMERLSKPKIQLFLASLVIAISGMASPTYADHTPVAPFDLFLEPPRSDELPPDAQDLLDDPVPLSENRSVLERAIEKQERKRVERFKQDHQAKNQDLPQLSDDREQRLETLFEILQEASNDRLAKRAEAEIQKTWTRTDSATIDLLFSWAATAMEKRQFGKALDFLDNIIQIKPDFAEAWNRRATVHFLKKDYVRSIADVEQTLVLEPRHFGALAGLGIMLRELGFERKALEVFKQALEVNPTLTNIKQAIKELEAKVGSRGV